MILPRAWLLVAMSRTTGRPDLEGTAMERGLVPSVGRLEPWAAMTGEVFIAQMPTMPSRAIFMVQ
jgi:hypothetical protein